MKKFTALLLIVAAVFASYAPALRNGFVWDDTALVLRDPLIRSWRLIPEGFNHFLFVDATASDFYRPIQRLSYTLEYAAFAFRPLAYHLSSIFFHSAAAVALFFLAEELLLLFAIDARRRRVIAFFATLVWAIHPAHSAAVAYISGRADPLSAAFGFLGAYLVLRGARARGRTGLLVFGAATMSLLLSALSRETGLIIFLLPIVALALRKNWKAAFQAAAVAVFATVVYTSLRLPAEHVPVPVLRAPSPLFVRPITVARAFAEYAGIIVFPLNLHMERDIGLHAPGLTAASLTAAAWRELQTLLGIVLIAAAAYWMLRARKRDPAVFACLALGAISYLPLSGLFALNATAAEHWLYLPSAFLFLATAVQIGTWETAGLPRRTAVAVIVFAIWLAFLGTRTFVRAFDWKDQRTFLARTIATGGDSARMLINLGELELNEGKLADAAVHLHAALEKQPNQPFALINLAAVALKQNDFKLARELLTRATDLPVVAAQAHELLAVLEFRENHRADLMRLRLASRTGPPNWSIEKRYIRALDETGATDRAIAETKVCLATEWYRAETWALLSQLLAKIGRINEAAAALAVARTYDVHLPERGVGL
ncbi:MAG: tetratricopeptide repeat protein [Chthoniobacterales bacterium]